MFGGTEPQRQQSEPRNQVPITPEEEAIKRNTDCVYFLASPLTCKKGIECEYRHSDIARVNPRDCWYWLNGNCLNPKCAFRHPPLDGLLGNQLSAPAVNPLPPSQTVVPVASQGPIVPGKQAVPCIFFQKGYCLKGDMCPFMHAPYSVHNKTTQSAGATPVTESQTDKKTFGTLGKHTQEQKVSHANALKSTDAPAQVKSLAVVEKAPLKNEISVSRTISVAAELDNEFPRYRPENVHSSSIGNSVSWSNHKNEVNMLEDQETLYVKDAGEVSREPSPGFDVLVDDELRDSEYYPDEDRYGRTIGHDGMDLNTANEYDIGRFADYGSLAGVDQDMYHEGLQEQHGWEEQRSLSERRLAGSAHLERRRYARADSPVQIHGSDLRHHLSKQKRNNGLRSAISGDRSRENHADDRSYRAPRRDHFPTQEVSSRLRGRIKIPGRSVYPVDKNDYRSERETDRARHHSRLSSERPLGRLRDRIKGRGQEEYNNERNLRGSHTRSDLTYNDNTEFSGPKSLSELKVGKTSESYKQQINDRLPHGKRNHSRMDEVRNGEGDISFEGPKPLSEILKRKRKSDVAFKSDSTNEYNHEGTEATELKYAKVEQSHINEESIPAAGVAEDNNKLHEGKSSLQRNPSELLREDDMVGDEAGDDQRGGGDFDYVEQADGEDYNLDEGENADPEDEYFDEDDDADDFAKKMGVVYS